MSTVWEDSNCAWTIPASSTPIYKPLPDLVCETVSEHSQGEVETTSGLGFSQDRARSGGGWTTPHSIAVLGEGPSVDR